MATLWWLSPSPRCLPCSLAAPCFRVTAGLPPCRLPAVTAAHGPTGCFAEVPAGAATYLAVVAGQWLCLGACQLLPLLHAYHARASPRPSAGGRDAHAGPATRRPQAGQDAGGTGKQQQRQQRQRCPCLFPALPGQTVSRGHPRALLPGAQLPACSQPERKHPLHYCIPYPPPPHTPPPHPTPPTHTHTHATSPPPTHPAVSGGQPEKDAWAVKPAPAAPAAASPAGPTTCLPYSRTGRPL